MLRSSRLAACRGIPGREHRGAHRLLRPARGEDLRLGSALLYSSAAYEAAGKLTKTAWCVILGLGVALSFIPVGGLILISWPTIAAFVYLADVRPALAGLTRRSSR